MNSFLCQIIKFFFHLVSENFQLLSTPVTPALSHHLALTLLKNFLLLILHLFVVSPLQIPQLLVKDEFNGRLKTFMEHANQLLQRLTLFHPELSDYFHLKYILPRIPLHHVFILILLVFPSHSHAVQSCLFHFTTTATFRSC